MQENLCKFSHRINHMKFVEENMLKKSFLFLACICASTCGAFACPCNPVETTEDNGTIACKDCGGRHLIACPGCRKKPPVVVDPVEVESELACHCGKGKDKKTVIACNHKGSKGKPKPIFIACDCGMYEQSEIVA